jgi:hypothetical protein
MVAIIGWELGFLISFGIAVLAFAWALVARIMIWKKLRHDKDALQFSNLDLGMWIAVFVGCAAGLVGLVFFAP